MYKANTTTNENLQLLKEALGADLCVLLNKPHGTSAAAAAVKGEGGAGVTFKSVQHKVTELICKTLAQYPKKPTAGAHTHTHTHLLASAFILYV